MEESYADSQMSAGLGVGMMLFYFGFLALMIASEWKILEKGGKPGWACLIPIYGTIVHLDMLRRPWWWLLLLFVPFINLIILFIMVNDLSKAFGKGIGYTVGLIFFSFILYPMLAFGDADFDASRLEK